VWERVGCVLGIEPNEHRIPRFHGKYGYHIHLPENPERPNSPNVLPMSGVMLGCGILRFSQSQCFHWNSEEQQDCGGDYLNILCAKPLTDLGFEGYSNL